MPHPPLGANAIAPLRMTASPLPAHQTKHLASLEYPLPCGRSVTITQDDSNTADPSTGRTVWLGAQVCSVEPPRFSFADQLPSQVLAVYLHDLLKGEKPFIEVRGVKRRRRVVELGSGTGALQ